ncbi:MAG: hypothetical protein F9K29_03305 [Hyphomicrobiaceae bacterium]|nr:MAG: hypothetical protein F9K29_03305 [Hyphomicrobiaceae bacterium]
MTKKNKPRRLPTREQLLRKQRKAFRRKFGRDRRPGDPVFFDPSVDDPTSLDPDTVNAEVLAALRKAGAPPQVIFAYRRTGLLVTESTKALISPDRLAEWDSAIDEYFRLEREAQGSSPDTAQASDRSWHTDIPELQARPLEPQEYDLLLECLRAVDKILSAGATTILRMELAAALLASACSSAYESAEDMGVPEEAQERYDLFEELTVRRSRELRAQGRA